MLSENVWKNIFSFAYDKQHKTLFIFALSRSTLTKLNLVFEKHFIWIYSNINISIENNNDYDFWKTQSKKYM